MNKRIKKLLEICELHTGIGIRKIRGKSRKYRTVTGREVTSIALRKYGRLTLSEVGEVINKKHSTVVHHCKLEEQPQIREVLEKVKTDFDNYKY